MFLQFPTRLGFLLLTFMSVAPIAAAAPSQNPPIKLNNPAPQRAYLGINLITVTPELRQHFGGPQDAGVLIGSIEKGSPAEKAGLRVGDLVVKVNGSNVATSNELRSMVQQKKVNEKITIDIFRNREAETLHATLGGTSYSADALTDPFFFQSPATPPKGPTDVWKTWSSRGVPFPSTESKEALSALQNRIQELEQRLKKLEHNPAK